MMRMASFGKSKSKRIESSKSIDSGSPRSSPRKLEKTSSDLVKSSRKPGSNFITRLASMGSLSKSKKPMPDITTQTANAKTLIHNCEVAELEMAFKVFDANGDGRICISELAAVLRSLGGDVTDGELQMIMDEVDKDQDGFINLEEFKDVHHNSTAEDPIREAFATFDRDGNNLICADELRAVLQSLGEKGHTLEDCRRMISGVDQDGDGFVDFQEFQHLLSAKS